MTVALFCATALTVDAQGIRYSLSRVRVTVPVNSTDSNVITNLVSLTGGVTNASFDVSGLPAGASATLTDTNGNALLSTTIDTNLWLTLNTVNIAEGLYTFNLNASGMDTNGIPVTNSIPFILQAAHIWNGSLNVSNNWATAGNWLGGVPGANNDAVFGDLGAQTNTAFSSGIAFTNIGIDADTAVGSVRFAQSVYVTADTTNALFHTVRLAAGRTLSITGTNGFSVMRDYISDFSDPDRTIGVTISGGVGSRVVVSNEAANFSVLVGNTVQPTLSMSNLNTLVVNVSRLGLADFQTYPLYREINNALNSGRDTNGYSGFPRRLIANIYLARTNFITANYKDPDNYTNEFTRGYALGYQNNEQSGNGSSVNTFFLLGASNVFWMDGVCFIRASSASGNTGFLRFVTNNGVAIFRSTNGGRMSVFTVSDDGGTNGASSNVKANIDFATGNGFVDILADRLYISRDRTMIQSNQTPNVQGDLTIGRGIVDVNTAILGYQEHSNKVDWTTLFGYQPYLNYCQGRLFVTNGGTVRVNGTLTLGYTADNNPEGSAQQYNTYGQITIFSNSTVTADSIVCDGGLNFTSISQPRQNRITITRGTLLVTNTIGDAPGLTLDALITTAGTNVLFVNPARTNIFVKSLQNLGATPTVIRIASLTGVSSYPVQIPLISYETATPFMVADVSTLGAGFQGYILDNVANKTIDVYITTNPPNTLIWRGNISSDWDTTTKNWITAVGGLETNFTLGDSVTFDDSSAITNVNIVDSVVPGQSGTGVSVNNTARNYVLSGGTIAGTSSLVKQGTGTLEINVTKQGPVTINAGALTGSGQVGSTTIATNVMMNFSGFVNGGLISTGAVVLASGSSVNGGVAIRGGSLANSGTISTAPGTMTIVGGALVTNTASGIMNVAGGNWQVSARSILANFGTINTLNGRLNVAPSAAPFDGGKYFGTGFFFDPDGGLSGIDGRFAINPSAVVSAGDAPENSVGTMFIGARVDLNNTPASGIGVLRVDVDFGNSQTNDIIQADKWNNVTGMILMTNINPGAGTFADGQVFQIFQNNNGSGFVNTIDVNGTYPLISPTLPGPGLQWGMAAFRPYGLLSVTNTALVWDGNGTQTWDTNSTANNWKSGQAFSDNQGAIFDDTASGSTTVTLTTPVAPAGIAVVISSNVVAGVTNFMVTTNFPAMSPGMIVSNAIRNYTFMPGSTNAKITGMTGLYKAGSGTLTILTTNDFTGNSYITGGTVEVTNVTGLGVVNANGVTGNGVELFFDGAGGTLRYLGLVSASWPRAMVINANNATIDVASSTNELTAAQILGPGGLTKTGPGTLVLNSTDSFQGGTTLSAGTLRVNNGSDRLGTGTLNLAGGTLLFSANPFAVTNSIAVTADSQIISTNNYILNGPWGGSGTVSITNSGVFSLSGNLAAFSGVISLGTSSGNLRFNNATNANNNTGSAAATFDLGTASATLSNLNGGAVTYHLGALLGGANTILAGRSTNSPVWPDGTTYSIGANGSNTAFYGTIANGLDTVSVVKVGPGGLALNGNNTYTGLTTVSAGTLGGTGVISGPVTVTAGGTLAPGASIGTLTINNALTNVGTVFVEVSKNGPTLTSDKVVGLTSVVYGGALVVSNVGPNALVGGESFQLFNIGGSGDFTSINPALTGGLSWNFDPTTGILSVIGGTTQPTLSFVNNGISLTFSWTPASGFKLQSQTNSLNVGLTSNWGDYPGGGTPPVNVPIDPAQGTVFFRLISTP